MTRYVWRNGTTRGRAFFGRSNKEVGRILGVTEKQHRLSYGGMNAGDRRRAKLAYMLKEWDRAKTKAIGLTK